MPIERPEDTVARGLEAQGYIVIRTYKRGCPDLIAIPSDIASRVLALEVKAGSDHPTRVQREFIEDLKTKGLNADYHFTGKPSPVKAALEILTPEERRAEEWHWFKEGVAAFHRGESEDNWPRHADRGSAAYHRIRANWRNGWDKANKTSKERL